jgi:outer membrane PBP1 activator LpoA protein
LTELRASVQQLWPGDPRHRGRLFAMGYDVLRLIGRFAAARGGFEDALPGLSGRLTVDGGGRVRRGLDWAVFGNDGQIRALGAPAADH